MKLIALSLFFYSSMIFAFEPFQPLPLVPPIPIDNQQTKEKISLGRQLFNDPVLSVDNSVSCNTCHNEKMAWTDGLQYSVGANNVTTQRSTPTLLNVAFHNTYNWDGRSKSLEEQLAEHLFQVDIMGNTSKKELLERVSKKGGYQQAFNAVFPNHKGPTLTQLVKAISSYERTLVTPNSPFDRYLGGDKKAISIKSKSGFNHFIELGCASCHFYVNLAGPQPGLQLKMGEGFWELFPNMVGSKYDEQYNLLADIGLYTITGVESDKRMWRMPTLRNIERTAPYFHNGSVRDLAEAVRVMAKTQLDKELSDDVTEDIVSFLKTLTSGTLKAEE